MNNKQLDFKATPDGYVRQLKIDELIREGDYVEWIEGDYTNIEKGSEFINKTQKQIKLGVLRIEKVI